MARYKYDSDKVESGLEDLNEAYEIIEDVNKEISKGIKQIIQARGSECLQSDFDLILKYKNSAQEVIDEMITSIREKANTIEDYNNSSVVEKIFSTTAMAFMKLVEGVGVGVEQVIVDGVASLTGSVVGLFDKDAQKSIGKFVEKDHVGDSFKKSYKSGFLSGIEKYSIMSSKSTAANIFKGVGVAVGYTGIVALGGVAGAAISGTTSMAAGASAALSSLGANVGVATLGGIGAGTQRGLQSGKDFKSAQKEGFVQGAIQGGSVLLFSMAANKISKLINKPKTIEPSNTPLLESGTDALKIASKSEQTGLMSLSDDIFKEMKSMGANEIPEDFVNTINSSQYLANNTINPCYGMGKEAIITKLKANGINVISNSSDDILSGASKASVQKALEATSSASKNLPSTSNLGPIYTDATLISDKITRSTAKEILQSSLNTIKTNPIAKGSLAANLTTQTVLATAESTKNKADLSYNINGDFKEPSPVSSKEVLVGETDKNETNTNTNDTTNNNSVTPSTTTNDGTNSSDVLGTMTNDNSQPTTNKLENNEVLNTTDSSANTNLTTASETENTKTNATDTDGTIKDTQNQSNSEQILTDEKTPIKETNNDNNNNNNNNNSYNNSNNVSNSNNSYNSSNEESSIDEYYREHPNANANETKYYKTSEEELKTSGQELQDNSLNNNSIETNYSSNSTIDNSSIDNSSIANSNIEKTNYTEVSTNSNSSGTISPSNSNTSNIVDTQATSNQNATTDNYFDDFVEDHYTSYPNSESQNSQIETPIIDNEPIINENITPSIDNEPIINDNYADVVTNTATMAGTTTSIPTKKSSGVIPAIIGVGALGAAAVGGKIYMDKRKESSNNIKEEDNNGFDFADGDWSDEPNNSSTGEKIAPVEINENGFEILPEYENEVEKEPEVEPYKVTNNSVIKENENE